MARADVKAIKESTHILAFVSLADMPKLASMQDAREEAALKEREQAKAKDAPKSKARSQQPKAEVMVEDEFDDTKSVLGDQTPAAGGKATPSKAAKTGKQGRGKREEPEPSDPSTEPFGDVGGDAMVPMVQIFGHALVPTALQSPEDEEAVIASRWARATIGALTYMRGKGAAHIASSASVSSLLKHTMSAEAVAAISSRAGIATAACVAQINSDNKSRVEGIDDKAAAVAVTMAVARILYEAEVEDDGELSGSGGVESTGGSGWDRESLRDAASRTLATVGPPNALENYKAITAQKFNIEYC